MKNNKKKIAVIIALIVLALIALIAGYTYSKYASTTSQNISTAVAKWSLSANIQKDSSNVVSLAATRDDENTTVDSNTIAPGTNGSFSIVIDATGSEVDLDYDVTITEDTNSTKPENLYFEYNNQTYSTLDELISALSDDGKLSGTILNDATDKTVTADITWTWPYDSGDDEQDVEDSSIGDYSFDVVITGTQRANS